MQVCVAVRTCLALISIVGAVPLHAQDDGAVPKEKQRLIVHRHEKRPLLQRFMATIGLTDAAPGPTFALIAGVTKYPNMPAADRTLPPAEADLANLQSYLTTIEAFDEVVLLKDGDVTLENLDYFLSVYFPRKLRASSTGRLLVAYTGHGMTDDLSGFLLKSNARSLTDRENAISLEMIRTMLDDDVRHGYQVLVLLNACYGGSLLRRTFGGQGYAYSKPGAHAITAGAARQLTWSDPKIGPGSVFFEKIFAGLGGAADMYPKRPGAESGDGVVTVDELYTYLKQEIQAATPGQDPQMGDLSRDGSPGGFFFFSRPQQIAKRTIPEWQPRRLAWGVEAETIGEQGAADFRAGRYDSALAKFMEASNGGNLRATFLLGALLEGGGDGVPPDYARAFQTYTTGAENGDAASMNRLGLLYYLGVGVLIDRQAAVGWFQKAAELGSVEAWHNLALSYENGWGVGQDYEQALHWYERASAAGYAPSKANLGRLYYEGTGVPRDDVLAIRYLRDAAVSGSAIAADLLGVMSERGHGMPVDYAAALALYQRAAEAGNAHAYYHLGGLYERGRGVRVNVDLAVNWYRRAAEAGDQDGARALQRLGRR